MATLKKRLNISLSKALDSALGELAVRDAVPVATKASQLLETALEIEEDVLWNNISENRDIKGATFVSDSKAWL